MDTSVLVAEDAVVGVEAAISLASITELHFGLLVAVRVDARSIWQWPPRLR